MAEIATLSYRTFDELLDSVRLDLRSFNAADDIDAAELIKKAQQINYELGLRIYQQKETMLEIDHGRTKLPADYHQMLLALVCHQYHSVQTAPWNHNVLLEEICSTTPVPNPNYSTCPCWTIGATRNAGFNITYTDCLGIQKLITVSVATTKLCAISIDRITPAGAATYTTAANCYIDPNDGSYTCNLIPSNACNICNVTHSGNCPEAVINPYPLGKCRTICNDTIGIKILQYCQAEVRCYEQFERLWIEPYIQAEGFNRQGQFRGDRHTGSITGKFLETSIDCGKVYVMYLGGLEDDNGNLLVLDHPSINMYYEWELKRTILENLWLNGEDLIQRVQYAEKKVDEWREKALSIANMPNYRDVIKTIQTIRANYNRQYYHPISRYFGYLGYAIPVDNM